MSIDEREHARVCRRSGADIRFGGHAHNQCTENAKDVRVCLVLQILFRIRRTKIYQFEELASITFYVVVDLMGCNDMWTCR